MIHPSVRRIEKAVAVGRQGPVNGAQQFEWWKNHTRAGGCNVHFGLPVSGHDGLSMDDVRRAVDLCATRHEALRTVFTQDETGRPAQLVLDTVNYEITRLPKNQLHGDFSLEMEFFSGPFPLDETQFRVGVTGSEDRIEKIYLAISHTVFDGYSLGILTEELSVALGLDQRRDAASLAPVRQQPIDSANDEATGALTRPRTIASTYWQAELRKLPNRMFVPRTPRVLHHFEASYSSSRTPVALALVARRFGTSAAAVYSAMIHMLLTVLSRRNVSVVHEHVMGRTAKELSTIGCYHHVLPIVVDMGDRPSAAEVIRRSAAKRLRVQTRERIDFLELRRLMTLEESRRGVSFADGSTVNFTYDDTFTEMLALPTEDLREALNRGCDRESAIWEIGRKAAWTGLDTYHAVRLSARSIEIQAAVNAEVFSRAEIRALLAAPEQMLLLILQDGDLEQDEVAAILESLSMIAPDRTGDVTGTDITSFRETEDVLRGHPLVIDAWVTGDEPDRDGPTAYVGTDGPVSPADLRDHVMAHLAPAVPVALDRH